MRAWTALLTIGLSLVLVSGDWGVATPRFAIGAFGRFAGLVLLSSARGGLAALGLPLVLATIATVRGGPASALLVGWYGLGVVLAAVTARGSAAPPTSVSGTCGRGTARASGRVPGVWIRLARRRHRRP